MFTSREFAFLMVIPLLAPEPNLNPISALSICFFSQNSMPQHVSRLSLSRANKMFLFAGGE